MTLEKRHVTSGAAILVGAFLFYLLGSALLAHAAHADAAPTPPAVAFDWTFWAGIVVAALTVTSMVLHHFHNSALQAIAADVDKALRLVQELRGDAAPPAPIIVRVPAGPPTSTGGGGPTAAMLAVLLLGGAMMQTSCAGTGAVVKQEASYLAGCSTADAAQIINASAAIANDAKAIKAGADKAAAAIDVIIQLALIHAAYAHCKATAEQPVASVP